MMCVTLWHPRCCWRWIMKAFCVRKKKGCENVEILSIVGSSLLQELGMKSCSRPANRDSCNESMIVQISWEHTMSVRARLHRFLVLTWINKWWRASPFNVYIHFSRVKIYLWISFDQIGVAGWLLILTQVWRGFRCGNWLEDSGAVLDLLPSDDDYR